MYKDVTGFIFQIQRFSVHDGDGLRTTVFFKGCPLRCRWCHNPEGLRPGALLAVNRSLCVHCGRCQDICPQGVHSVSPGMHSVSRAQCRTCGACAAACPTGALHLIRQRMSAGDVVREALRDAPFYTTGGGITCSGGECTMQPEFLLAVLITAKEAGLNTAVDTCGFAPSDVLRQIAPYTDAFLYDIKAYTPELHRTFTGADNALILSNYRMLHGMGARLDVRIPLIPTVNDSEEEILRIGSFLREAGRPHALKVIPYHSPGHAKYAQVDEPIWEPEGRFTVTPEEAQRMLDAMLA